MSGDPAGREELRAHVRTEPIHDDEVVLIRGGPETAAKLLGHARRLHTVYVLDGLPVFGVSAMAALDALGPASLDGLLASRMASYRVVHMPLVGALREAGFQLLPTFRRPHVTVLLDSDAPDDVDRLLRALGPGRPNPYHGGGRRRR